MLGVIALIGGLNLYFRAKAETLANLKQDRIARVTDNTHTLVNNNMQIQLALNAKTSRALANVTGKLEDAKAADAAEWALKEHLQRQREMDLTPASRAYQPD